MMDEKDIAEQAFKNGYEKALKDIVPDGYRATWKMKFFEAKKEIERLMGSINEFRQEVITLNNEKLELQKQVDELKKRLIDEFEAFKKHYGVEVE